MTTRNLRRYQLPDIAGSNAPISDFVGVITPEETTNLIVNPSFETNTTSWAAVTASIARSAAEQYHGTYSLAITPTAGTTDGAAYTGALSLTSGTTYTASLKIKGAAGVPYKLYFATSGGVALATREFKGTGRWQWVSVTYTETSTNTRRVYITKNGSTNTTVFYIDGVQVEAKAYPTTYCDGDQLGLLVGQQPAPYLWTGTPHASTSTRSALTRAGGKVVDIKTAYGFLLTSLVGLGMAVPNNVSVPYTTIDGARWQRTTKPPRTFSLVGRFQATTAAQLSRQRSDMRSALDRDLVPVQQPLVLMVEPRDECGPTGDFVMFPCVYDGGLEGNDTSALAEDVAPTFTMYVPFLGGGDAGAALSPQSSVSNANNILQRSVAGVWSAMSTGANNQPVRAIVQGLDGTIYAGGDFTDMGGSGADYLAKWDGSAWAVVKSATSLGGLVYTLAVGPDGRIYLGGDFINADGIAAADYIAVYDPAANTYAALGTGANAASVKALAFAPDGTLYAGGSFTLMGGVANTVRIAKWNGSAWSALSTGMNGQVLSLAVAKDGTLYAAGDFTTAGGTTVNRVAKWNGSAWSSMDDGSASSITAVAIGPDGRVYAGGDFTTIGGVSATRAAVWNGTGWAPLGSGLNAIVSSNGFAFDARGVLYACGAFTTAGGITLADSAARWNGSTWLPLDVDFPGSTIVYALRPLPDGRIIAGFDTNGSATSATVTTVTNSGPAFVWPRVVIKGPSSGTSRIYQLVNYTTGFGIYLNLTISAGETVTIDADPQAPRFVSDFQGDISGSVLPGSQPAYLYLAPGNNSVSFYAASSSVTATLSWQKRYNGTADLVN